MKLESINIKRLRSIEMGELSNCGRFNVLIGKNNSGKSNILSAIHTFFSCIENGNFAILNPPIGKKEIDYFERNRKLPIEITLIFSVSLAERDALIRDIVTEAPQMKNAVDGIDPALQLQVTINIISEQERFAYISKLVLGGTVRPGENNPDPERIILSIGKDSASEIHQQLSSARRYKGEIEAVNKVLNDSKYRLVGDDNIKFEEKFRDAIRSYSMRNVLERDIATRLIRLSENVSSFEEFSRSVKNMTTNLQEEAKNILSEPLKNKIGTFSGEETFIPNYARNLLLQLSEIKVLYLTERRKQIGKEEAERLLSLKVRRGGPEVLRNIQETVSALLGVKIDAFRGEETAELDVDDFLVEVNGSGIREALRLILDYEFKQPNILLIEEPEVHLHPALETSIMQYLKRISENCQVFITTHSTNFLDTAEMENIYLVSRINSTQIQHIDLNEAEAMIPRELGMRLSSLFMYDRLVFVEGPSDEAIIRELASILNINLNQSNVGFVHMGGIRNFTHYAAEETLGFLTKRQVKMLFIIDRDEKSNDEITKLQARLKGKAKLLSLNRREIENYLLSARAILEFIKLKNRMAGKDQKITDDERKISQLMNSCIEELKQFIINKRVAGDLYRPVYPINSINYYSGQGAISKELAAELDAMTEQLEHRKGDIEGYYKKEKEYVESIWDAKKFEIVPGDMLLDIICKKFGTSFNKMQDGKRLASLMRKNEIDIEFISIINEIGS